MNFFGDSDIPPMMAAFGVPITIGVVAGVGIVDLKDEAVQTSDGPDRGIVVLPFTVVTVQTSAFPNCAIDDYVLLDGKTYTVRERLREGDGALTKILLGAGPVSAPSGDPGPQNVIDGGMFPPVTSVRTFFIGLP